MLFNEDTRDAFLPLLGMGPVGSLCGWLHRLAKQPWALCKYSTVLRPTPPWTDLPLPLAIGAVHPEVLLLSGPLPDEGCAIVGGANECEDAPANGGRRG